MNFHHIGVACKSIENEIETIKKIHSISSISDIVYDIEQDANLCLIKTNNGINIELISGGIVRNILKKRIQYYHICFEVNDLINEINRFVSCGAIVISEPKKAILFNNLKVAFLYTSYGLVELLEKHQHE